MAQSSIPKYKYFNLTYPQPSVAHVEINRPDKLNAFIEPMWLELRTVFDHLSHDPSTRTVLLSGAGPKAFTAGIDIHSQSMPLTRESRNASSSSTPPDIARSATRIRRHIDEFQACISSIEKCEKPVVAIMHGFCFGLGIDIACCADIRICAADTRFSVKEVDIGIAADIGTLTRLPKIVGAGSWVKDVCLSARIFGAEEAAKVGFVSWVGESKENAVKEGIRWGQMVADKSPVAVQSTKELLNWSKDKSVQDGLRYTGVWNSAAIQTSDLATAISAGIQRKTPRFEKL